MASLYSGNDYIEAMQEDYIIFNMRLGKPEIWKTPCSVITNWTCMALDTYRTKHHFD
jgi:hypothetical protein